MKTPNFLNPKKIIISQITEQLEANKITGIKEMFILIPKNSDKAEIVLRNICDKTEKVDYEIDRKNTMIKIFLNKFNRYCEEKNISTESYTIKINLKTEEIDCYVKDIKGQLHSLEL